LQIHVVAQTEYIRVAGGGVSHPGWHRVQQAEYEAGRPVDPSEFAAILAVDLEPYGPMGALAAFARETPGGRFHGAPTERGAYHAWGRCRPRTERPAFGSVDVVAEQLEVLTERLGRPPTPFEVNKLAAAQVRDGADPTTVASMVDVERAAQLS